MGSGGGTSPSPSPWPSCRLLRHPRRARFILRIALARVLFPGRVRLSSPSSPAPRVRRWSPRCRWCRDAMRPSLRSDPILPGGEGQSPSPQPPLSWPRSTASSAGIARLFLVCGSRVSCPCTRPGPGLFLDPSHPCSPWPAGPSHSPSSRNRGGAPTTDRRRVFFFPQTLYSSLLAYGALGCSPSLASVSTANQTGHLVHYRAHSFICCFHAITSLFFFRLSI